MTTQPSLHIKANGPGVAKQFADFLVDQLNQRTGPFTLALSGGSTPKLLFKLLANDYREDIDWSRLVLFWGDERCVPHTDPDSNYGLTRELLLNSVPIPAENIHPVNTALAPQAAAADYAQLLEQYVVKGDNGLPVFDLIMLGMGDDGHTASIFPHESEFLTSEQLTEVATHPISGQKRVTFTGPVINNAWVVAFLVTGHGKTARVAQILNKEHHYQNFPAAHIAPQAGELHWFMDEAAALEVGY
ncbi:MAG: 6-phosphogluconolactonase [Bacteroidota bacterium]